METCLPLGSLSTGSGRNIIMIYVLIFLLILTIILAASYAPQQFAGSGSDANYTNNYSNSNYTNTNYTNTNYTGCLVPLRGLRSLVSNFDCKNSFSLPLDLNIAKTFTLSVVLNVIDYDDGGSHPLFNLGSIIAMVKQGILYLNDCMIMQLNKATQYHLVLIQQPFQIEVYLNGQLAQQCPVESKTGTSELVVGSAPNANILLTLLFLDVPLAKSDVSSCWQQLLKVSSSCLPTNSNFQKYQRDCSGNDIAVSKSTLSECQQACLDDEQCLGISYDQDQNRCVTKSKICKFPGADNDNHIFYRKISQPTPQYTRDCPSNDICVYNGLSLPDCQAKCMGNCVGVSYNAKEKRCVTKSKSCPYPGTLDDGHIFYPSTAAPFIKYQNDCSGNDIQVYPNKSLSECIQYCQNDPKCVGVSYSDNQKRCVTKSRTCPFPGKDVNDHVFYRNPKYNYIDFPIDCTGNDISVSMGIDLAACQKICQCNPQCVGVSYDPNRKRCVPKNKTCPYPGDTSTNGHLFHQKIVQ